MDSELTDELGGAKVSFVELFTHRREGRVKGLYSQSPCASFVWLRRGRMRTWFSAPFEGSVLRETDSVIFHPPNVKKRSEYLVDGVSEMLIAGFSFETAGGLDLLSFIEPPRLFPEPFAGRVRKLMGEFERLDSFAPNPFRTIALRKASLELLDVLLRASKVKDAAKVLLRYGRLRPVVEELNGNYAADLDVGALAKKACLSRPQFHRQFKALVGLPPLEYAKRLRLKEAERLLRSSDLGMREIGERVGWPNQFHFSRIFKGFYGVPPLRYRQASQSRGEVLA